MSPSSAEVIDTLPGSEPARDIDGVRAEVGEVASNQHPGRLRVASDVAAVLGPVTSTVTTGLLDPVPGSRIPVIDIVTAALPGVAVPDRSLRGESQVNPVVVESNASVTRMAYTSLPSWPRCTDPTPTIQSPTSAVPRMRGLQVASVQCPKKGFGANPESCTTT